MCDCYAFVTKWDSIFKIQFYQTIKHGGYMTKLRILYTSEIFKKKIYTFRINQVILLHIAKCNYTSKIFFLMRCLKMKKIL